MTFIAGILLLLLAATGSFAATATVSSNLVNYSEGKTLSLSYSIQAEGNAGTASDIYFAAILPDNSILLLDSNMAFTNAPVPFIKNTSLASVTVSNFISAPLPGGLPEGIYEFYLVIIKANADPAQISNWLGSGSTSISYTTPGGSTDSYIYYKRGAPLVPQAATISFQPNASSGTLKIDGKSITGIYYTSGVAGQGCLGGGSGNILTRCFSPTDLPNTILLCGPDPTTGTGEVLLYVMFQDPSSNRVSNTASNYLAALQSEHNYLGANVFRSCSGSVQNSWIRNYPATNYYQWPDVITTYSPDYVSNLLNGAAIYSTPAAGNEYYEYVVVRTAGSGLEVWH